MTTRPASIAASAISGIRWNYVGTFGLSFCSLVIGIVLARILGPKPFGQTIIATMIYGLINMFVDGGFSQALIQKKEIDDLDIRKTFTYQICIGLTATGIVAIAAPWIAILFRDPTATPVIRSMSLMMTFQSMGLVSAALLRRSMRFKVVQTTALASYLFGYLLVGIPLAVIGFGVWSLVCAYLSQSLFYAICLYIVTRHPVVPCFHFPDRSISGFGIIIVATNIVNWGHSNLDNFSIGNRLGPVALGLYGRACNFAYQPVGAVVNGLQSVVLSSTARVQERKDLLRDMSLAATAILLGIVGPAYATFAMLPDTTIMALYGNKWVAVIPVMIPLALAMPFYGAHALLGPIVCGMGKPHLELWPQGISCAAAAVLYMTAARYSLVAVGWALLAVMILRLLLIAGFLFPLLQVRWSAAAAILFKRGLFSAGFAAVVWLADHGMRKVSLGAPMRLAVVAIIFSGLLGACVWYCGDVVFGRHAARFLLTYAKHLPGKYARQLEGRVGANAA